MFFKYFFCGVTVALPFVFPKLWFLSWFSLVPFVLMLLRHGSTVSKRRAYGNGFGFGLGFYLVIYYWFTALYPLDFMDLSKIQAVLLIFVCWWGLATLQTLDFALYNLFYRLIKPKKDTPALNALLFTCMFAAFEWQQSFFWRGVPWARLALTQSAFPQLLQSASLFGGIFTGCVICAVNAFIAAAIYTVIGDDSIKTFPKKFVKLVSKKKTVILSSVALGIFAFNAIFGIIRYNTVNTVSDRKLVCAAIQGNVSSLDKWADNSVATSLEKYTELTKKAVNETGADLVVWPETVLCYDLSGNDPGNLRKKLGNLAKELDIILFVGAFEEDDTDGKTKSYNSIYIFTPDGKMGEEAYRKQKLVPFGEYTPMESLIRIFLPILFELNILPEPFYSGTESVVFKTPYGNFGSLVCFDSIHTQLSFKSVRNGAELITLSTNDSWFRDSAAVYQHNAHAELRAIETGRYIVRAANTGISSIISPSGETISQTEPLVTGYTTNTAYLMTSRTLYSYIGNLFVFLANLYIVFYIVYFDVVKPYIKKKKTQDFS